MLGYEELASEDIVEMSVTDAWGDLRGTGTRWAETMSRVGTILGFYVFPLVLAAAGLPQTLMLLALVPLAGMVSLLLIRWEPIGQDVKAAEAPES